MNLWRKLLFFCIVFVMWLASLTFFASTMSQHLFKKDLTPFLIAEMDVSGEVKKVMKSMKVDEKLQVLVDGEVEKLNQKLIENEEFNSFVNTYSIALLNNIADENAAYPDINQDIRNVIDQHTKDIESVFKGFVGKDAVKKIIDVIKESVDMEPVYQTVVEVVRNEVSPEVRTLVKVANIVTKDVTKWSSVLLFVVGIILLSYVKQSFKKGILITGSIFLMSGIVLFMAGYIVPSVISQNIKNSNIGIYDFITNESQRMNHFGLFYIVISGLFIGIYAIFQKRNSKKI